MAAAIGERTEFMVHAKRTAPGSSWPPSPSTPLALPMQRADEREEPPRGVAVERDLAFEPFAECPAALVVQRAAAHVDRLDARGRRRADRLVVALADDE